MLLHGLKFHRTETRNYNETDKDGSLTKTYLQTLELITWFESAWVLFQGFFPSSNNRLITPLYVSIQAVKLLTMLANDSTNDVSDGHHAEHFFVAYDRDVSDPVIWKKKKSGKEIYLDLWKQRITCL